MQNGLLRFSLFIFHRSFFIEPNVGELLSAADSRKLI